MFLKLQNSAENPRTGSGEGKCCTNRLRSHELMPPGGTEVQLGAGCSSATGTGPESTKDHSNPADVEGIWIAVNVC